MKVTLGDAGDFWVWPYCPSAPLRESLEWMTDLMTSRAGTDRTARYRERPRQTYTLETTLPHPERTRAMNALIEAAHDRWIAPIWPERSQVASIAENATTITVDTETAVYEDLAVIWQSPRLWEVVAVVSVGSGEITLAEGTKRAYTNAVVMPARVGRIVPVPSADQTKRTSALRVVWQGSAPPLTSAAEAQYQGEDFEGRCHELIQGVSVTDGAQAALDILDEQTGRVRTFRPATENRLVRAYQLTGRTRSDSWALREFLHRRAGRLQPFWAPTFLDDVRITSGGALGDVIEIADDGYQQRQHIAVQAASWALREVTGVERIDDETLQLTLDSAFGVNAADVRLASYLLRWRLAVDRVEIVHMGRDLTRMTLPVTESPA